MFHARPHGKGDDEQLVRVTHVAEGCDEKLNVRFVRGLSFVPQKPVEKNTVSSLIDIVAVFQILIGIFTAVLFAILLALRRLYPIRVGNYDYML